MNLTRRSHKLKFLYYGLSLLVFSIIVSVISSPKSVSAAYDSSRLIDNDVFLNAASMSSQEIQNFLVARNSGLANRSFALNCYGPTSQERQLYSSVGAPCDQTIPASQIIYYASQIYGVNPRVVLATLQKEQSLISSPNPTDWQINQAMGYACPTTGQCGGNSTFSYQIDSGVWVLRYHYERANGNLSWWSPSTSWVCGTSKSLYSTGLYPGNSVTFIDTDGTPYRTITIANAATSSFYCYTPHTYNNHRNGAPNSDHPVGTLCYPYSPHVEFGSTGRCYTGSYNFVYFFELWFGSTTNPPYTTQLVSVAVDKDFANLPVGEKSTVTYTFKNAGSVTWFRDGPNPVRIGTTSPYDRASAFCDSSWISCARAAGMNESQVSPGQNATFTFVIQASKVPGLYLENFGLLSEGLTWMSQNIDSLYINTIPANLSYSVHGATYPSSIQSFETKNVTFQLRNTGNVTWYKGGKYPINLATTGPNNRTSVLSSPSWIASNRPASLVENSVAPNQVGTFSFNYNGPAANYGTLSEQFTLVAESFAWFGQTPPLQIDTTVISAYDATFETVPTITIPKGEYYDLTIRAKNNGTTSWTNNPSSASSVKLVTDNPLLNQSGFCDSSWISGCNRIAYAEQSSVSPNADGTFRVRLRAPPVSGFHPQAFSLYSEAYGKFVGSVTIPVNVVEPNNSWVPTSITAYSDSSKSTTVRTDKLYKGRRVYVEIKILNTGNTRWFAGGATPTRLATSDSRDRISAYCDPSWLTCNRVATVGNAIVEPNTQTTIGFWYKAPNQDIFTMEHFSLVTEGKRWLDTNYAIIPSKTSSATLSWEKVDQYAYTDSTKSTPVDLQNLSPNQRVFIGMVARNTGTVPWVNNGSGSLNVGTNNNRDRLSMFCDSTWYSCARPASFSGTSPVEPTGLATFDFWYKAPSSTGTYNEAFSLLSEGQSWLNDTGTSFYTIVK